MFSSLEFADGPLYATEIARSGARCRFAFLSACETGRFSTSLRLEPDGLVRAFLACSARGIVASLWPLDDEAASIISPAFYASTERGATVPRAMAEAREVCRESLAHPYFWSSFAIFGGYPEPEPRDNVPAGFRLVEGKGDSR